MRKKPRRRFTKDQKAESVRLFRVSGMSYGKIAEELGIWETSLRNWVRQADIDEGKGPLGSLGTSELEELRQLRRENKRLRMERDILKKATAFFARESSEFLK